MSFRPPELSKEISAVLGRKKIASPTVRVQKASRSKVPEEGWNSTNARGPAGRRLIRDLVTAQRVAAAKGIKSYSQKMRDFFDQQANRIVARFDRSYINYAGRRKGWEGYLKKEYEINIDPGSHYVMWDEAISSVLGEMDQEFYSLSSKEIQSVADIAHTSTVSLLGGTTAALSAPLLNRRVRDMASQVTNVSETTRRRLRKELERAVYEEGLTVAETVQRLRKRIPEINANRIPTIARTEMGRAADEGRKQGLKDSGVVTHVSVIGCESREQGSPQYRGESTCNIQNVPIGDVDQLVFHPNHTGTIVASRFKGDEPEARIGEAAPPAVNNSPTAPLIDAPERDLYNPEVSMDEYKFRFESSRLNFTGGKDDLERFSNEFDQMPDTFVPEFFSAISNLGEASYTVSRLNKETWSINATAPGAIITRSINMVEKVAEHRFFTLETGKGGKGFGKELLKGHLPLYKKLGIKKVRVHANIDVGGYAWARYGFVPDAGEQTNFIRGQVGSRASDLLSEVEDPIAFYGESMAKELSALSLANWTDPTKIRSIAALKGKVPKSYFNGFGGDTIGKALLLGSDWEGELDLTDPVSLKTFQKYLGLE